MNFQGTFACSCDFGYEGDGYHCIDHDECEAGDHLCPGLSYDQKSNDSSIYGPSNNQFIVYGP